MSLARKIEQARVKVDAALIRGEGASGAIFWMAASDALEVLEANTDELALVDDKTAFSWLHFRSLNEDEITADWLLTEATPAEILADMQKGTADLREETKRIKARNEFLIGLGMQLGQVGARLVLAMLV